MGVLHEVAAVRGNVGLWQRESHTVVEFSGRDARAWLQSQTTNDLLKLEDGHGNTHALLDRQGRVQCFFSVHRWADEFWVLIEKRQKAALFDRLETHLFLEELTARDVGGGAPQICVEGPRSLVFLARIMEGGPEDAALALPAEPHAFVPLLLLGHEVLVFRQSESGEDGFLIIPGPEDAHALYGALLERGLEFSAAEVGETAREVLRIEAGRPRFGVDIGPDSVIAETPLEATAVSYDKGCYPGQEVVARLKAYGSPKQALTGMIAEDRGAVLPPKGAELLVDGRRAGVLRSHTFSPTLDRHIALASLGRDHRTPGAVHAFAVDGETFEARVTPLPFVTPPSRDERAAALYNEALSCFERDETDSDDSAIELLSEAVLLAPAFEDAYEALGVILHRHHRTEEAIRHMKVLARLNPRSVMAHANLSVFYVAQGRIAEAEEEKAIAAQLEARAGFDALAAKTQARAERARIREEAEQRIAMFKEVLEIDPEDPVATMGLASAYVQLDRHADAVPWLEAATRAKKDYSAAFLKLGQCHEVLGDTGAARAAYRRGIEAASRKGDLMPLREMERRLNALGREAEVPEGE